MTPLTSPLVVFDEQRAINRTAFKVATIRHQLTQSPEQVREVLERLLVQALREGELDITLKAVAAAYQNNDEIADAALRLVGGELQMAMLQGEKLAPGHLQVIGYFQGAGQRDRVRRKRGAAWYDDWLRNVGICLLIVVTTVEYGLNPTRNRESKRANRTPSSISVVTAALKRNRIHLAESSIQQNLWLGLPGELVCRAFAKQMGPFSVS